MAPVDALPAWELRALDRSLASARARQTARAHRLVEAAKVLAAAHGSADFTVADVAEQAGVSLRSFYRQFSGKDELLVALFEEEALRGATLVSAAMAATADPLERVERYVVGLWELMAAGSGYASMLVREHLRLGERRPDELREALRPLLDLLDSALHEAAAAGRVRAARPGDAVLVFSVVLAHVHTAILLCRADDPGGSAAAVWDFCATALAADLEGAEVHHSPGIGQTDDLPLVGGPV